jgi:hypothetical protein
MVEAPNAEHGDWDGVDMKSVGSTISQALKDKLVTLDDENGLTYCIKSDKSSAYVLDGLVIILHLKLANFDISVSGVSALQTNMVKIFVESKKQGVAKHLYELLVKNYNTIVCDYTQYDGARALWKSLAKGDYYLYLYNEVKDILTKVNNFNNDKDIWSFSPDVSKEYILLVVSNKVLSTNPKF